MAAKNSVFTLNELSAAVSTWSKETNVDTQADLQSKLVIEIYGMLTQPGTTLSLKKLAPYITKDMGKAVTALMNVDESTFKEYTQIPTGSTIITREEAFMHAKSGSEILDLMAVTRTGPSGDSGKFWGMISFANGLPCGGLMTFKSEVAEDELFVGTVITFDKDVYIKGPKKTAMTFNDGEEKVKETGAYLYKAGTKYCVGYEKSVTGEIDTTKVKKMLAHKEELDEIRAEKELAALTSKAADTMDGNPSVSIAVFGEMD